MKKRKVMQAEVLADRKVLTHEEWLNVRRQGIGGSEAGAILGLSPFSSAFSVYAEKIGVKKADEANEAMRIGTDLEPYVAQRFMEATGKRVVNCNYVLTNPNYKFMLADVDRLVVGENAGLECKTTSAFNKTNFIQRRYYKIRQKVFEDVGKRSVANGLRSNGKKDGVKATFEVCTHTFRLYIGSGSVRRNDDLIRRRQINVRRRRRRCSTYARN